MRKYFEILRKCTLFDNIERDKLEKMLVCLGARVIEFDKKYTILSEGSTAKYLGVVLSGSAQVIQVDYYGNRSVLSNVYPSEIFGEAFACAKTDSIPVSVIANEPCEVMLIDCSHILHICHNNCDFHQQLIYNLMKDLAQKTVMFHQRIEITSKRTTREKLLAYLSAQSKKAKSVSFDIPFDRQELADYLGIDRSGLSAEISKLRKEGIIENRKKHFVLL